MVEVEVSRHYNILIVLCPDVLLQVFSQGIYEIVIVRVVDIDYKHGFVGTFRLDSHCYHISKWELYRCEY